MSGPCRTGWSALQATSEELKGLTRIYVSASDSAARDNIITKIKKRLPQLTITERAEDAEVWLVFSAERRNSPKGDPTIGLDSRTSGTSVTYEIIGTGTVIKPVSKQSARRLIDFRETTDTTTSFSGQVLSSKFASAFIKSYQKANPKRNSGGGSSEPEVTVAQY